LWPTSFSPWAGAPARHPCGLGTAWGRRMKITTALAEI
jgi:hypothetical protein